MDDQDQQMHSDSLLLGYKDQGNTMVSVDSLEEHLSKPRKAGHPKKVIDFEGAPFENISQFDQEQADYEARLSDAIVAGRADIEAGRYRTDINTVFVELKK